MARILWLFWIFQKLRKPIQGTLLWQEVHKIFWKKKIRIKKSVPNSVTCTRAKYRFWWLRAHTHEKIKKNIYKLILMLLVHFASLLLLTTWFEKIVSSQFHSNCYGFDEYRMLYRCQIQIHKAEWFVKYIFYTLFIFVVGGLTIYHKLHFFVGPSARF